MKSKLIFLLVGILCLGMVTAGIFYLKIFNFGTMIIKEPLSVQYNWTYQNTTNCSSMTKSNYQDFTGSAVAIGRDIYPGNTEVICFKINSLSDGSIPLNVNVNYSSTVKSYWKEFPSSVKKGDNYGYVALQVAPDADGTLDGSIQFGRGN